MKLIDVTIDNLQKVAAMEVHPEQKKYIASNLMTVAQSKFYPDTILRVLVNDEEINNEVKDTTYLGMVAYFTSAEFVDEDYTNVAFIARFMIDQEHQGQGYGTKLMDLVKEEIISNHVNVKSIHLTVVPSNKGAKIFYENYGFVATGKQYFDEDEYCLIL